MMNMKELILVTLSEECGEISQNVSKALRFGQDSKHCEKPENGTNAEEILVEFYQLQAMIEYAQRHRALPVMPEGQQQMIRSSKIKSFENWAKVSRKRGCVE